MRMESCVAANGGDNDLHRDSRPWVQSRTLTAKAQITKNGCYSLLSLCKK